MTPKEREESLLIELICLKVRPESIRKSILGSVMLSSRKLMIPLITPLEQGDDLLIV